MKSVASSRLPVVAAARKVALGSVQTGPRRPFAQFAMTRPLFLPHLDLPTARGTHAVSTYETIANAQAHASGLITTLAEAQVPGLWQDAPQRGARCESQNVGASAFE